MIKEKLGRINKNLHLIYILTDFINKGLGFFLIPYFTHTMTPLEFGEYEHLLLIFTFFQLISWMSQNTYLIKEYGNGGPFFQTLFGGSIIVIPISILISLPFVFSGMELSVVLYMNFTVMLGLVYSSYISKIQVDGNAKKYIVTQLACSLLNLSFSLLFVFLGYGGTGRFVGLTIGTNVVGIIIIFYFFNSKEIQINIENVKERFYFSLKLMPHNIVNGWLKDNIAKIVILYIIADKVLLGMFGVVFSFSFSYNILMTSINNALNRRIFHKDHNKNLKLFWFLRHIFFMIMIYIFTSPILYFLYGVVVDEQYQKFSMLVFVFCFAFSINSNVTIISNYLISKGRSAEVSKYSSISILLYVLGLLSITYFGIINIYIISLLYILCTLIHLGVLLIKFRGKGNEISRRSIRVN